MQDLREKILGIDIDGVIRDCNKSFIKTYNNLINSLFNEYDLIPEDYEPSSWFYHEDKNFRPALTNYIWNNIGEIILYNAEPYEYAVENTKEIFSQFPTSFFISHQHSDLGKTVTREWINKYFDHPNILFVAGHEKYKYIDILIDDCIDNLNDAKKNNKLGIAIDRNWNKVWKGPRMSNLINLSEFKYIINEYYKK